MYEYQIDCESAMNKLIAQLEEKDPVFNWQDIFDAFQEANKEDTSYLPHLMSAIKHNQPKTVRDLLDYACACDMLIFYKGSYIAVDWTDNDSQIISKVDKHTWLKPIYEYLGIEYTLVVKATGYIKIKTKSQEMIAKLKASSEVMEKIDKMVAKQIYNSSLTIKIKTSF